MNFEVHSQVSFQALLTGIGLGLFILYGVSILFLSIFWSSEIQVSISFSTLVGVYETFREEFVRWKIRKSKMIVTRNRTLLLNPTRSPSLTSNQFSKDESNKIDTIQVNSPSFDGSEPDSTTRASDISHSPQIIYNYDSETDLIKRGTSKISVAMFTILLLIINYGSIPLNIILGYKLDPYVSVITSPISEASLGIPINNFYNSSSEKPYTVHADYSKSDQLDDSHSNKTLFDYYVDSRLGLLMGTTALTTNNTIYCGLIDKLEHLIIESGFSSTLLLEQVPLIPRFQCVYNKFLLNQDLLLTTGINTTGTDILSYVVPDLNETAFIGDNITTFAIHKSKIYASTIYLDNSTYSVEIPESAQHFEDILTEKIKVDNFMDILDDTRYYGRFNNATYQGFYQIANTIRSVLYFAEVSLVNSESFVISFTLPKNTTSPHITANFTRVVAAFDSSTGTLMLSQLKYHTRAVVYEITEWLSEYSRSYSYFYWDQSFITWEDAQIFAPRLNVKVSPTIGGFLQKAHGFKVKDLSELTFDHYGPMVYNVTIIIWILIVLAGLIVVLSLLVFVIFANRPSQIPMYYELLHFFHGPLQGDSTKSIFSIAKPAYVGKGYMAEKQTNHIGVISKAQILDGPRKNIKYG